MRIFSNSSRVLFWVLVSGIAFNMVWSMRLESKAQKLQSVVEAYHERLESFVDTLPALKEFKRVTETGNNISLNREEATLSVGKSEIGANDFGIFMNYGNMSKILMSQADGIRLSHWNTECVIYQDMFRITGLESGTDVFTYSTNKELVKTQIKDAVVRVGKGKFGQGVELGEFATGTVAVTKDHGLGISARGKNPIRINGQNNLNMDFDGDIDIVAKGDISIRSENGQVKINGKEIHLNE